jgi:curved DNA-binding protein CbpA
MARTLLHPRGMTSPDFDPYQALGVGPGASEAEIRAAYKALAAKYHPDKHRGNPLEPLAAEKLQAINRAREMLLDGRSRSRGAWGGAPRNSAAPAPRSGSTDLVSWLGKTAGTIVTVLFLLRFGTLLFREAFAIMRALMMGLLWVMRISPICVIALMVGIAMLTGYWLKARHRER